MHSLQSYSRETYLESIPERRQFMIQPRKRRGWIIKHPLSVLCASAVNLDLKEAPIDLKGQWNQFYCTEILLDLDRSNGNDKERV
jgi:hypothetical protein